jgi:hypothetical protein
MIRVEIQKWGQSLDDLRRLALQAEHPAPANASWPSP